MAKKGTGNQLHKKGETKRPSRLKKYPNSLIKPVVILHEGKNDKELLELLIQKLELDIDRIGFLVMRGKSDFFKSEHLNYQKIKDSIENEQINKLLFVVDADYEDKDQKYGGYKNTKNELKNIIDELGITEYSDIYIVCDPTTKEGYLESLILSTIPEQHKKCIENFLSCSEFKSKDNHKSILNQIYKIAYPNKPYDFSHKKFDTLKQKLINLLDTSHE
ncbi:DUF3226 domain-containing protein [Candidatus Marithrix sp. Canyon 246]|nr:DUF3226 domain-containing protein [Candidatus Marithrix sp. Canyon 246]